MNPLGGISPKADGLDGKGVAFAAAKCSALEARYTETFKKIRARA